MVPNPLQERPFLSKAGRPGVLSTRFAKPVQGDLMRADFETCWDQFFQAFDAFCEVEDRMAFHAVEVVVMPFVGPFIPWRLSRDFHAAHLSLFL